MVSSKKIKRKKFFLKALFLFVLFLIISAGVVWSLYIPKLKIQKISVEGAEILSVEKIIANISDSIKSKYIFIIPKNHILIASKEEIANNLLSSFPRIKELTVNKNFPNSLAIIIKERQSAALLCGGENNPPAGGECAYIDEDGFVFEKAPYFSGEIFLKFFDERDVGNLVTTWKLSFQVVPKDQFRKLIDFKNYLFRENIKIPSINLKKDGIYELQTNEGWVILLNERNDFRIAFENLKTALDSSIKENQKNLEYIDLRFGNKVFYK